METNFVTIIHIFGAVIGAGGAYLSDAMFFMTVKDHRINKTEFKFLILGSVFVWAGLITLYISGALLFFSDPDYYLNSDKFLAKFTIVLILTINGFFFHKWHLPILHRHQDVHLPTSKEFNKNQKLLVISGVLSVVSWTSALILGSLRDLPYSYLSIMTIYFGVIFPGVIIGYFIFKKFIFKHQSKLE